ncbi:MAG: transcription antitermination factor NusB [Victivallales bacterium]|nr:transcription antitermination factor NusB [Victivallales bacterium]
MDNKVRKHYRCKGRELALQYLFQFDLTGEEFEEVSIGRFMEQALEEDKDDRKRQSKGRKYAEELIRHVVANLAEIDDAVTSRMDKDWSWQRIPPIDRAILRLAAAEMLHVEKVPPIVAINEALELGKTFGSETSRGFINALLNNLKDTLERNPRGERRES